MYFSIHNFPIVFFGFKDRIVFDRADREQKAVGSRDALVFLVGAVTADVVRHADGQARNQHLLFLNVQLCAFLLCASLAPQLVVRVQ